MKQLFYPTLYNLHLREGSSLRRAFKLCIREFDKPLCYAADWRRRVHQTVHKEQICKYDKGFANSPAQGFLSDVYKKHSTRAKKLQA